MCYDCRNQARSCFSGVSMTSRAGTVSITYESSPDRRTVVINGAVGGILNGPEVVVDLYVERGSLPDVTQELDAQGKPIPGTELPINRYSKTREIQTTVVLNPEMAIGLGQYLIRLGEQAQSQMEAVSYPGPVKPSSISDGIWFQYFAASSGSPPTCVVAGEPFQLDVGQDDSDGYVLHHRHWSLCGFGDTLEDAVQDLWAMARTVAPDYLQLDSSELTDNAQGLRTFLQRVL